MVFGGFAAQELARRIEHAEVSFLITLTCLSLHGVVITFSEVTGSPQALAAVV